MQQTSRPTHINLLCFCSRVVLAFSLPSSSSPAYRRCCRRRHWQTSCGCRSRCRRCRQLLHIAHAKSTWTLDARFHESQHYRVGSCVYCTFVDSSEMQHMYFAVGIVHSCQPLSLFHSFTHVRVDVQRWQWHRMRADLLMPPYSRTHHQWGGLHVAERYDKRRQGRKWSIPVEWMHVLHTHMPFAL